MASSWGLSWGSSWGNSWGSIAVARSGGGDGGRRFRVVQYRERIEEQPPERRKVRKRRREFIPVYEPVPYQPLPAVPEFTGLDPNHAARLAAHLQAMEAAALEQFAFQQLREAAASAEADEEDDIELLLLAVA